MQECDITLRLAGSLLHTVPKTKVTPAEIVVLRHMHGADAVVEIVPTRMNKRRHEDELQRLNTTYGGGAALHGDDGADSGNVVARCFPGAAPRLPVTLKDIGLGHLTALTKPPETAPTKPEPDEGDGADEEDTVHEDA